MSGFAFEFERVSYVYKEAPSPALNKISLKIPSGQCVVFTGESGCGKTTLTRLMNALIPMSFEGELAGDVRIFGTDLQSWKMDELCRRVGSVFQNPRSQFFNLDTTSEIAFGCENLGISREEIHERVDAAFCDLGIEYLRDRDILKLSGGQRQLIAIASAYALGPDVFVFDEPTAALDIASMKQLASIIEKLKSMGKTVIIAEHRLWWLSDLVDRVVVMKDAGVVIDVPAVDFVGAHKERHVLNEVRAWDIECLDVTKIQPAYDHDAIEPRAALDLRQVSAGYAKEHDLLRNVQGVFEKGRVYALVGANGSGKTTFLRCLLGLHKEKAGSIFYGGSEIPRRKRPLHAYLVMQETGYQLFCSSVEEELKSVFADRRSQLSLVEINNQVNRAMTNFCLSKLKQRHPLSLSGGQRQRLASAVGLLRNVDILVLDEPTSGLDLGNMFRVAQELRGASDSGICVIVVTHDYEFICSACDYVVMLKENVFSPSLPVKEGTLAHIRGELGF